MNNIITDIKSLQEETLLNLQSSKAKNTIRAYKSDFNDFSLFCAQNGFKSLPSEPKIISLYLTHLSTKDAKISTLKRRLVSIGVIHKINAIKDGKNNNINIPNCQNPIDIFIYYFI